MTTAEKYMSRCIQLAQKGAGSVSPNPMVGCVIVHNNQIIGEGYHEKCGQAHAEVNAIASVTNKNLLKESTLYVSLEPCAHYGKTPPCSDLIVEKQIPHVVIGTIDPFAKVAGKGIEKLKNAGIKVELDILGGECRELNRRFFTYHQEKRPFVILKWAQTRDGFIDFNRTEENFGEPTWITGPKALKRVHQLRAEEDAIMVGTNTAQKDNPSLTVRHCEGKNPLRIVLDRQLRLQKSLHLFNDSTPTIIFNASEEKTTGNTSYVKIDFSADVLRQVLDHLYSLNQLSLIVEGGQQLLNTFIENNLWDEAHVYTGNKFFKKGIKAPKIAGTPKVTEQIDDDELTIFRNKH